MFQKFTLVLLTLVLSACSFNFKKEKTEDLTITDGNQVVKDEPIDKEDKEEAIQADYESKESAKTLAECQSIADLKIKESCVLQIQLNEAINSNDEKLCEEIKDNSIKNLCVSSFAADNS
jgi:hypothetical protein